MNLSDVAGITLEFIPNPAGEDYDGHWGLYRDGLEIARSQDLNWARNILAALNETRALWMPQHDVAP